MIENVDELIFNLRYNFIYYISALIVFLFVIEFYFKNRSFSKYQNVLLILLLIIITFFFGYRGLNVGIDTPNNAKYFIGKVKINSLGDLKDIGIYIVSILSTFVTTNVDTFLTIMASLYIIPIYAAIKNLELKNPLIFFFFLFSLFFFKTMGINTIRQGLAFSIYFYGLILYLNKSKIYGIVLFTISFFFHASIIIPICLFIIAMKFKKLNIPLIVFVFCTLLSVANVKINTFLEQIPIVNILVQERLDTYYIDTGNYKIGFRPDFWLFNTIFIVIGYYTNKNIAKFNSNFIINNYQTFFVAYIFLSSFFFLMFSARFSDRFGFLSWMFIPLLLLPYAQSKQKIGLLNTFTVFLICIFLATIFKLKSL